MNLLSTGIRKSIMLFIPLILACLIPPSALEQICCAPPQWEVTEISLESGSDQHNSFKRMLFRASYDAENKRMAVVGNNTFTSGKVQRRAHIDDFAANKTYWIYPDEEICFVEDLQKEFPALCIKDSDVFLSSGTFGMGDNTINTKTYLQPNETAFTDRETIITDNCFIVIQTRVRPAQYERRFNVGLYTDYSLGIADMNVFTPPAYCEEMSMLKGAF